jgi:hypothetical protein
MTINETTMTKTGTIVATFDKAMRLTKATHYNGRDTRSVRRGGLLWSKLERKANYYRYKNNR